MDLSDVLELISFDLVIEVMGLLFAIGLLWSVFFGGEITNIIELLIEHTC